MKLLIRNTDIKIQWHMLNVFIQNQYYLLHVNINECYNCQQRAKSKQYEIWKKAHLISKYKFFFDAVLTILGNKFNTFPWITLSGIIFRFKCSKQVTYFWQIHF